MTTISLIIALLYMFYWILYWDDAAEALDESVKIS